jgi:hypothetical protein
MWGRRETMSRKRPDDVSIDEMRARAKAYFVKMGWQHNSRLAPHSVIELMAAFGMKAIDEPRPETCGYPSCGCDFDAVCNVVLPSLSHNQEPPR